MSRRKRHRSSARIIELALLIGLPIAADFFVPVMTLIPWPYTYGGLILMLIGLGVSTWGARTAPRLTRATLQPGARNSSAATAMDAPRP